eukprot:CAMPEP_0117006110 /NCGR_PEP_ID=MMETSP0472-20121206/6461_1 /TAXON_ID=693140 ORGANISM="Tiarina fusus, Strain LIS" /NCGR_SAMPLE_ID=MMETSP0472 /ASSEMBLY_ACC=CAM_ASM_000603 /LENGTH=1480 /DNA_ID=CAMNT_0004707493 /DNA_START=3884 /DNA_END=8326 /DNA_ORIENTATION=+
MVATKSNDVPTKPEIVLQVIKVLSSIDPQEDSRHYAKEIISYALLLVHPKLDTLSPINSYLLMTNLIALATSEVNPLHKLTSTEYFTLAEQRVNINLSNFDFVSPELQNSGRTSAKPAHRQAQNIVPEVIQRLYDLLQKRFKELSEMKKRLPPVTGIIQPKKLFGYTKLLHAYCQHWISLFSSFCKYSHLKDKNKDFIPQIGAYVQDGLALANRLQCLREQLLAIGTNTSTGLALEFLGQIQTLLERIPLDYIPPNAKRIFSRVLQKEFPPAPREIKLHHSDSEDEDFGDHAGDIDESFEDLNASIEMEDDIARFSVEKIRNLLDTEIVYNSGGGKIIKFTSYSGGGMGGGGGGLRQSQNEQEEEAVIKNVENVEVHKKQNANETPASVSGMFNANDISHEDVLARYQAGRNAENAENPNENFKKVEVFDPVKDVTLLYEILARSLIGACSKQLSDSVRVALSEVPCEFCLMIDNSRSIQYQHHKRDIVEMFVLLCECFKQIESPFAITRFGNVNDERFMLKRMSDSFSFAFGEQIIESLTFDQATRPASALKRLRTIWNQDNTERLRVVIMLTDGLTNEHLMEEYKEILGETNSKLIFFLTSDGNEETIKHLCPDANGPIQICTMNARMEKFPLVLETFASQFDATKTSQGITLCENHSLVGLDFKRVFETFGGEHRAHYHNFIRSEKYFLHRNKFAQCSQGNEIPFITEILGSLQGAAPRAFDQIVAAKLHEHRISMDSLILPHNADDIEAKSSAALKRIFSQVNELVGLFDTYTFPPNIPTRRKCSTKGSSLYLPGLIKAVISNYNYKKFYSVKQRGGRRDYAICIAVDISLSVRGQQTDCMFETLLMIIAALEELSITKISIITFHETIEIVKSENESFNLKTLHHLLNSIPSCVSSSQLDYSTNDGDAIMFAIELLKRSQTRGTRHIYLLTDGYSSSPQRVTEALYHAQRVEIPVTAIGVGGDRSNFDRYSQWVYSAIPSNIPKAIRIFYERGPQSSENIQITNNYFQIKAEDTETKIHKPIVDMESAFRNVLHEFRSDDTMKLVESGGQSTIDICYCIDCTGSMNIHLDAVKNQLRVIANDIFAHINNKFGDSVVIRSAVVGYRDTPPDSDESSIRYKFDFSPDKDALTDFIEKLECEGGQDLPEDVLSALTTANELFENLEIKGNNSFLILVTDAPGHGLVPQQYMNECTDNINVPEGDYEAVLNSLCDKNVDLILIQVSTLTSKMEELFKRVVAEKRPEEEMIIAPLRQKLETYIPQKFHFIFVLDKSHSMKPHWATLTKAYDNAVRVRLSSQADDLLSVIKFDFKAKHLRTAYRLNKSREFPALGDCGNGSTNYESAMQLVEEICNDVTDYQTKLVFMSDGKPSGNDKKQAETLETCLGIISRVDEQLRGNLHLSCLAFCYADGDPEILRNMGKSLPDGRSEFREISEENKGSIVDYFSEIAGQEDLTVITEVIANSISEAVKSKLTPESF